MDGGDLPFAGQKCLRPSTSLELGCEGKGTHLEHYIPAQLLDPKSSFLARHGVQVALVSRLVEVLIEAGKRLSGKISRRPRLPRGRLCDRLPRARGPVESEQS